MIANSHEATTSIVISALIAISYQYILTLAILKYNKENKGPPDFQVESDLQSNLQSVYTPPDPTGILASDLRTRYIPGVFA